MNSDHNDRLLEKSAKFGKYHFRLFAVVFSILLIGKTNDTLLIFGAYSPSNFSCSAIKNETKNVENIEFVSFVTSWTLCGRLDYVPSLMNSIQLTGSLIGGMIAGPISDRYGRKITLILFTIYLNGLAIASFASHNWQMMVVFRFLIGIGTGAVYPAGIVLLIEMTQKRNRFITESCVDLMTALASIFASLFAVILQKWNLLSLVLNCIGLPLIVAMIFTQDSIRWLVQTGKYSEANRALMKIRPDVNENFLEIPKVAKDAPSTPILCLFQTALLRQFSFAIAYTATVTGLLNFGYVFNVNSLTGSVYLNVFLLGVTSALAPVIVLIVDRSTGGLKRKLVHSVCLLCLLAFTIVIILLKTVFHNDAALKIASFFASSVCLPLWTVTMLLCNEHFPTQLRNQANGFAHVFTNLGGIAAPFALYAAKGWAPLPYVMFGSFAVVNMVIMRTLLIETRGKRLPELSDFASKEAEQRWIHEKPVLFKNNSYFSYGSM